MGFFLSDCVDRVELHEFRIRLERFPVNPPRNHQALCRPGARRKHIDAELRHRVKITHYTIRRQNAKNAELILGVRKGKENQPLSDVVHIPLGSAMIENEPFRELAKHPMLLKNRLQLRGFRIVNPRRVQKNLPHLSLLH